MKRTKDGRKARRGNREGEKEFRNRPDHYGLWWGEEDKSSIAIGGIKLKNGVGWQDDANHWVEGAMSGKRAADPKERLKEVEKILEDKKQTGLRERGAGEKN